MSKKRRIISILLSLCIIFSATMLFPCFASAKSTNYISIMHKVSIARENYPIRYNFSLEKEADIYFELAINERTTVALTVKNQQDEIAIRTDTLPSVDPRWEYNKKNGTYNNKHTMHLPAGDYILEMNFETEVNYELNLSRVSEKAKLNYSKLNLTKGFSKQLKVSNAKIKSCSSNQSSIASVTKSGKVTAKKQGKAKIKVKLSNGKTLTCTVSVKPNKYTAKKIAVKDVAYNTSEMKAYNAAFDEKGNLVLKFKLVNNSYGKITNVSKFKVVVKDSAKKTVVSYAKRNYSTSVESYSDKECTIKIPKSALKRKYKNIDLRTAKISITGNFAASSL